ncbi:hypothetical protein [Virgibacillus ihumii]|uniref:hypothetical protein n=1 Tax=Virgibacillus ihumii TaxID=2686091 RepID=UPI00157E073B|nr:hypothetical protein [Virgibacillus ihumii]
MNSLINRCLRFCIFIFALLHFFTYYTDITFFFHIQALSGLLVLLFAGIRLNVDKFKLPLFLSLTGVTLIIIYSESFLAGLEEGLLLMGNVIGLLIIVPLIGWVLREEPYIEEMMSLAHKMLNTSRKLYFGIASFTQIISYFLLFGAIPMMYEFINMILKHQEGEVWENFKGTALLRAYAMTTVWVVTIPSFTIAVETLNASLWITILQGIAVSICGVFLAAVFSYFEEKHYGVDLTDDITAEMSTVLNHASGKKEQIRKSLEFGFLFISLFGTIFLLHAFIDIELMMIIPMVIFAWASLYFIVKKKPVKMVREGKTYYKEGLIPQGYQFSVMLSVGIMIFGLNQTGFGMTIVDGMYYLQKTIPFANILLLLPLIVVIMGFMGLGPLTVMVLVTGILNSISLPYPPELVVLSVTSGSVLSILLSPLLMPTIVLSGTNGLSAFTNGFKFNYKYAFVMYLMVQVYIQSMVHL